MKVNTTREITAQMISDQFVAAFEGGCTYWLNAATPSDATRKNATERPWYGSAAVFEGSFAIHLEYDEAGKGDHERVITEADVKQGLEAMAISDSIRFDEIVQETGDALTADSFLQHILFGELVFG
jgi:hypothetical protein